MTPRLNKRQQRELDELSALATTSNDATVSSEDEAPDSLTKTNTGAGFTALFVPEEEDLDEDAPTTTKARKSKKKKKKVSEGAESPKPSEPPVKPVPTRTHQPILPQAKNEKKALKKARAREKKAGHEELNRALAELSVQYPELRRNPATTSGSSTENTLASLLSVSLLHLDSDAEMRKFFGAKVVSAYKPTEAGASTASSRRKQGTQRSYLAHPQPFWWNSRMHEGLSVVPLTAEQLGEKMERQSWDPIEGEKWWAVEYSKKYKSVTMSFMKTVALGDPDGFWHLLVKLPGHADTLLQLSEVYRFREEYSQAVTFVEHALFTYERSFMGAFAFTTGLNRLDFDRAENRPFFLAVHRQVTDLQRRGCIRTAFEFGRLLYSLDPWTDPYGALLHLDYVALKAGMGQWLLDVFGYFSGLRASGRHHKARVDPSLLPGWMYSRALAMRMDEDNKKEKSHERSTSALKEAILSFPAVVPLLADKLDVSLPNQVRASRSFRIETSASSLSNSDAALHLLSHLYAQRSFPIWKDPEHCTWFADTVTSTCASNPSELPQNAQCRSFNELYALPSPRYSLYRHIIVLDDSYRRLSAFIPKEILEMKMLNCDPLPPPTCVSKYDEEFFKGVEDPFTIPRQDRAAEEMLLARLIPDPLIRGQLQAFFDAHPQIAERIPGGIVQFAQLAGQLPEELLEEMMIGQVAVEGDFAGMGHGGMPGQMPGENVVAVDFGDNDVEEVPTSVPQQPNQDVNLPELRNPDQGGEDSDGDDESDDDEDVAPMPIRLVRNIMNRLWGRNTNDDSDDSSNDANIEQRDLDEAGVD